MVRHVLWMSAIAVFTSSTLLSADWLAFRGQDGSGKSPDTGLLKKWSPQGPTLLWSVDFVGMGYAGVTISGDRIYTSGNVGERSMVFCLDKDGKKIWEAENGPAHADTRRYHGTRGAPTIDGDFVYDVTPLGEVAYFNAKTGEKIWNKNLAKNYDAPIPRWLFGHSVVVDGDHLICLVGGAKTLAVALNKRTGAMVWEAPPASNPASAAAAYTTPYFFEFDGIRIVAVMSEATVEGLDPKTGKRLFSIPWTNSRNVHCTMPIYQDGHLFLSTGYDGGTARLFKLTKNANGTIMPTEVWVESRFNNHHGGVVMVGDHVYGTSHDGQWCSINFMTGEIGYRSRGAGKGAAHYADGLIYGLTEDDKTVLLIKPDPKEFILLSSFELPNDAEGKSWAHPVVLNGRLYLRHAQYLYCYDVLSE